MLHSQPLKEWLLIFYSVPSRPVSNRMRIWRRLIKVGAVQLKGAVYMLPYNEENYEFCQWLVSEVSSKGGEGTFVKVKAIETMKEVDIINLFNSQRDIEYYNIAKRIEGIGRKIESAIKGGGTKDSRIFHEELRRYEKEFQEIRKIDFFSSKAGGTLEKRLKDLYGKIRGISEIGPKGKGYTIVPKSIRDYKNKIWVTRKRPFVDRMASAWLIRKFINKEATFRFIDERDIKVLGKDIVTFDIRGGEFTHHGDMCTFEVIIRTFGLKDRAVKRIARIVHEIDLKDDKYRNPEATGLEEILTGIRKVSIDDTEALEKGISLFEMIYASKT
ncbi:MAG: chromate resistance protein [Nitrospirae bacterium]|nr:chromate resistance protein [Nitrospirota bacterium]